MLRVVVDTNTFISGLFWGGLPGLVLLAVTEEKFQLLLTTTVIGEWSLVISRDKFAAQREAQKKSADQILADFTRIAEFVTPSEIPPNVVRDPKDVPILAAAVGGKADYIVTGDKDLLTIGSYESVPIVEVRVFLQMLNLLPKS
jgi:uncharacterized protein